MAKMNPGITRRHGDTSTVGDIPEAAIQMGQHFSILLKEEKLSNLKAHTKTVVVN